ncbi:hypothetical protein [Piscirickettsia salmonis]|nr:hypothetical protein [Piscirickettsia salmonis]QHS33301.1 hypothetical protein GW535_13165 [Piscirickettsia salmonis]QIX54718.1 hypothetical protein GW536_03620 [Piscirickettsia salmonis]
MKRKEQASIMPNLFIAKGQTEQAHFKSNVFFDSSSSFLFNVRHKGKDHSVLVNYQWSKGKGKIDIILKTDASEKKISGNLFKRIYGQNEDLKVVAFSNGGHLQLGFGDFSS